MTEQFKVGEIAIFQNAMFDPSANGQEVEITVGLHTYLGLCSGIMRTGYAVRFPDGHSSGALPHQLRKKRPPSTGEQSIMSLFKRVPQRNPVPA